jgi:hypothetical protein
MNRCEITPIVLALLATPLLLPSEYKVHASPVEWDETVAALVDSVSETSFIETIQTLEDFGSRHSSLPEFFQASCTMMIELNSYGYQTWVQSFKIEWGSDSIICWNLIAEKEGLINPDSIYIICSHLDSTAPNILDAPGADDNASGSAAVIEAARVMKDTDFENTVRFVCFGGEEQGLVGSFHYAEQALSLGENLCGTINMDMILYAPAGDDTLRIRTNPQSMDLATLYQSCAMLYVPDLRTRIVLYRVSDYYAFWYYGYPALGLIEETLSPWYHSSSDLLANYMAYFPFGTNTTRASVAAIATLAVPVDTSVPDVPQASTGSSGLVVSPNPSRGLAAVSFSLLQASTVDLQILDLNGRLVQTAAEGWYAAGDHQVCIGPLPSGVYFIRLDTAAGSAVRRFVSLD